MWWFRAAALFPVAIIMAGCGFESLYGESSTQDVDGDLAAIEITLIADRIGQQLHNTLRDGLNPRGKPVRPLYTLQVELDESIEELAIRKDETATRANLSLRANFDLLATSDGAVLVSGSSLSTTSYNILSSEFATLSALADARRRGVRALGNDIKTRLSLFFKSNRG
jgi:LPS-assembly lipoprotein